MTTLLHESWRVWTLPVLPWRWRGGLGGVWGAAGTGIALWWPGCAEGGQHAQGDWGRNSNPHPYLMPSIAVLFHCGRAFFSRIDCVILCCENWGVKGGLHAESCHWPKSEKAKSWKMPTATRCDKSQIPQWLLDPCRPLALLRTALCSNVTSEFKWFQSQKKLTLITE